MTLTRAPAHAIALGLCLGLAAANLIRLHESVLVAAGACALAAVASPSGPLRVGLTAVLVFALGWWWASHRLDRIDRSPLSAWTDRAGRVVAVVTAPPKEERFGVEAQATVRTIDGQEVDEPAELELPSGRTPPQGAVIAALVVVRAPKSSASGFDYPEWLRRHGIHVELKVDEWTQVGRRGGLGAVADRLREHLATSIAPGLTGERRAVLEGIVLGDDDALSDGLRSDFQASGLYHILAVSGQNVVLVAGGVLMLAWILGISRVAGELGALLGIGAYVLAVGPQPSVIRAGIAGGLASLAWLTGRLRDSWHALLLAAAVLLAWNPYNVHDPGFQLSFAAVVAIFTVVPRIAQALEGAPLPHSVRLGVAISAGCGIVTAPILWLQFAYLPIMSIPANALVEPAMPILLGLAFTTAGLDLISPSAAAVLASLNGAVAAYIALCARLIGGLPFAEVTTQTGLAAFAGILLLGAYAWHRWQTS